MDLNELQNLLDTAQCVEDLFGTDIAAGFRRLARICHPDQFPAGSHDAQWASALFKRLGDWRQRASERTRRRVVSPQRAYRVERFVASGDWCDVHRASSGGEDFLLKIPRRLGGNNLLAKEREVLEQLNERSGTDLYARYFPAPRETFRDGERRINVFAWREGYFTAEQIRARYPAGLPGHHLAWAFRRILEALGYVHQQGWIHGAVLPPHLLFHAQEHGLQLVDWIHAQRRGLVVDLVPDRFKAWYPGECRRKLGAVPATDIYLAAKSLVYLSGGDPIQGTFPATVPDRLQRFWTGCLLESPAMRPQDAWKLYDEFSELLEDLYGPPRYYPLDMS